MEPKRAGHFVTGLRFATGLLVFVFLLAAAFICDLVFTAQFYLGWYVAFLVAGAVVAAVAFKRHRAWIWPFTFLVYVLIIVGWPMLNSSSLGTYRRFYRHIAVGIDGDEVVRLFEEDFPQYRAEGNPVLYSTPKTLTFELRYPSSIGHNSDHIIVSLQSGVVSGKQYQHD